LKRTLRTKSITKTQFQKSQIHRTKMAVGVETLVMHKIATNKKNRELKLF